MNDAVHADIAPLRRCCRFARVLAALAAGVLIAAAPHRAQAQDSASGDRCPAAVLDAADAAHPPFNFTPVLLRVLEPSIEPVPATDGLIHLAYVAQVTNTAPRTAEILDVVAVDPLAGFAPTGRNIEVDTKGNDVTGKVKQFLSTIPPDPELEPTEEFSTNLGPRAGGTMLFDVTYTDPAQIPRLLAHAITLAPPLGTKSGVPGLTNPVPVGCVPLALLHPPLVGKGWIATSGCCTTAAYHRDTAAGFNGDLMTGEVFAIDFEQIGTNNSCCNGPPEDVNSWWAYGKPVLATAPGVVVEAVDGFPDQSPVGTVKGISDANATGNHVIEDIGDGHYVYYAHFMPGSIPKGVLGKGAVLTTGQLIGRVGNSGNSGAPHLHFDVRDRPTNTDATGLPFVFDTQLRQGSVSEADLEFKGNFESGVRVTIDPTGAGLRTDLMPARNDVFGFNLSQ